MTTPSIHSYPRVELEEMLSRPPPPPHLRRLFTKLEIKDELVRRDEINLKRLDTQRYPELQQSFH